MSKKNKKENVNIAIAFVVLLAIVLIITLIGVFSMKSGEEIIQGEVEYTELRISGKLPARIDKFLVKEGAYVKEGDSLVILDSPEIEAKMKQARAAEKAASALNQKANKGASEEQIKAAYEMWQKAQAGLEVAQKTYERVQSLYEKEVVPAQKRDEAEANYKAMQATEQAAKSQYEMAVKGASEEEKDAALAQLNRAKGAVAEVRSYMSETILTSPISGKIAEIFPQRGELVGSGAPIMNIIDTADVWVTFNIREADYSRFMEGTTFNAIIPALENKEVVLTVSSVKDLGSFAAWKATKVTGEFDSKTFEIKAVPNDRIEGLIGGMSVIIKK
ncbi:MAG: efflux RND transporter periplasmic adaptor subunit [Paludibacteraceae bacterium]|nr:efflux RND transporter periplasmic adaptor subunit [Paludibacteraceae bacterium]MBO7636455.1 efflux RND transporter periplasmic adaptor subunit [Paludibacteraceae bacterium]MBR5972748.1 efflux RND transporter periplasmic adaptor subunit [Paludibacteraceae bacterium]